MTQEEFEWKIHSLPGVLRDNFREMLEISTSKRIVNRFIMVVNQAYAEGQRAAWRNGAPQAESTEEIYRKGYDNGYEHGAEDMRQALLTAKDMSVSEKANYCGIDPTNLYGPFESLSALIKLEPKQILDGIDKYRDAKTEEKHEKEKLAINAMAKAIGGLDRVEEIVKELKEAVKQP